MKNIDARSMPSRVLAVCLFGLVYGLTAKLGFNYSTISSNVTLLWPPSSISLFAVLRHGFWLWPGIVIGDLIANAGTNAPLGSILGISASNIAETLACAWLLRRYVGFEDALERIQDVVWLLLLGTASAALSAFIGPTALPPAARCPGGSTGRYGCNG
ncbi:MAG: MASE1 domain-containing protein [Candidatus Protistobacter heckmanni]|nr:MASE1 domain-containing protein [Candidatus Protistobacter heckmanni]